MTERAVMTERVVVTGFGGITALGPDVNSTWDAIKQGKTGIDNTNLWDTTHWDFKLSAEIKDFDPRKMISDRKLIKMLSRHDMVGLNAVEQAMQHSQILNYRESLTDATEFNERTGVYVASPGIKFNQQYDLFPLFTHAQGDLKKYGTGLSDHVHPMWLLRILSNNVLAYTSIQYGLKGPNQNITNHGASGLQAIAEAQRAIGQGLMDRAVVVGYDTAIEPQGQIYYGSLGVLSKTGLRPYDHERDGTVLGEGAGAIILESLTAAKARGAQIYGEVLGDATMTEAIGVFAIRPDGQGVLRALQKVLQNCKLIPEDIGMISAHANGGKLSDVSEARAINELSPDYAIPVTGFKWAIGHTLAAAGVIETILTLLCLQEKTVTGIAPLKQRAADCNKLNVSSEHQILDKKAAIVINRGFASINTCLAIQSYE